MKKLVLAALLIPVIIAGLFAALYLTNFPLTEVAGEKIGFADLINFLLFQSPPNLPEADPSGNAEISEWFAKVNGSDAGETMGMLQSLGSPLKFCVFSDYSYCEIFGLEGGKIYSTSEASQKTLYVSYELAMELKQRAETDNYDGLQKRLVQAVKSGEMKGLTLNDVMNMGK